MHYRLVTVLIIISLYLNTAHAADINITVRQSIQNNNITVTAENNSSQEVFIDSIGIEIAHQRFEKKLRQTCGSHQKKDIHFQIDNPSLPGSYLLTATVRYLNDGRRLSVNDVRIFSYKQSSNLNIPCSVNNVSIAGSGHIHVNSPAPHLWRLVLPDEVDIRSISAFSDHRDFFVENRISGFSTSYPIFAVAEDVVSGIHRAGVCRGTLSITASNVLTSYKGYIPSGFLLGSALFFFFISRFLFSRQQNKTILSNALLKYTSRLFFLSVFYYFLKNADTWLHLTLSLGDWKIYHNLVDILVVSLHSGNYFNFFRYFIDAYCVCCVVFMFPYLYWLDRQTPVCKDKYVSFLKTLMSIPGIFLKRNIHWNSDSKLGMLTVLMKVFFVPLMVSWSISGFYNLQNSIAALHWNVYVINAFLVALFIFLDTTIFAFGYLIELPYLKNDIKSIDPKVLGWVVCLWCYPPFNAFSFKPFDWYVVTMGIECTAPCSVALTCVITLLWGIFVWASISLGFKASNLTNRGIVKTGPYCFVRHPAYAVKVLIWFIQGIFFGQFGIFIMAGFAIIYFLRAWTEERHLSMDPDYVEYMKLVKWRFIPGVI